MLKGGRDIGRRADADKDRVTVQEAAQRLGVKDDAIRKRIQRGTLEHDKDPDGRVYVYVDAARDEAYDASYDSTRDASRDKTQDAAQDTLLEELRAQNSFLRAELVTRNEELRRKDHIIAALTERIPEIEPPQEAATGSATRESAETASETARPRSNTEGAQKPSEQQRSWLYRFFFGPG